MPTPALATCGINLFADAVEGQNYSTLVTSTSTGAGFTCKVIALRSVNPPMNFPYSFNAGTAMFYCSPPVGSAGVYSICFDTQEYNATGVCYPKTNCDPNCYPAGGVQCGKCTQLTINSATGTGTGTGTIIIVTPPTPTATSTKFDYTVSIVGQEITSGIVPVTVDGDVVAHMAGGQSESIQGSKGTKYNVSVPSTIDGNSGTRFVLKDTPVKTVSYENPTAVFSFTTEYYVEFKTDPMDVAQLSGSNWYPGGTPVTSIAPETVNAASGLMKYDFVQWKLQGGGSSLSRDLALTVNGPGTYLAVYNPTPVVVEKPQDNTLMWILILVAVVVIAVIVIVIMALRKRGSQAAK
jgi:hypothetical protein